MFLEKEHIANSETTANDRQARHSSTVQFTDSGDSISQTSHSESVPISIEPENSAIHTNTPLPSQPQTSNPILELLRDQQLGKTVLTLVITMTAGVLALNNNDPSSVHLLSAAVSLSIGLTALWNGMLLRNTLPDAVANAVEQFGAGAIFFAFFSVIGSLLPPNFAWVPWTCFVAVLVASILSCIPVGHGWSLQSAN